MCQRRHVMIKIRKRIPHHWFLHFPRLYSCVVYASALGKYPNLIKPTEVCELLMKLNIDAMKDERQKELRVLCADKFAVRQYVKDKGCGNILNELYGVYERFEDIKFDDMPERFVVKTNYACGQNLICTDKSKLNIKKWTKQFDEWMAIKSFGLTTGEWHYTEIPHKIIVEKYLGSLGDESIIDYKFQCFHGKVFGCLSVFDRKSSEHGYTLCHYDKEWKCTNLVKESYNPQHKQITCPKNLNRMIQIAETLSADFPYCRVDLYNLDGDILFGELTFTPAANTMVYYTDGALRQMLNFYYETSK